MPAATSQSIARTAVCLLLTVLCTPLTVQRAQAYDVPKSIPQGWQGVLQFGGQATMGVSRTTSLSAATKLSYASGRWENLLTAAMLRSDTRIPVDRRDAEGEPVVGINGVAVTDLVNNRTSDRRFIGVEPKWYMSPRYYLFSVLDYETNEPGNIENASRQIVGVGYKLWSSKADYFSAGIGIGNKRLKPSDGVVSEGGIGYVGMRFVRQLNEKMKFDAELDSDFGSDNRSTALELGLSWLLRDPVSLKLKYEARTYKVLTNPLNPLDDEVDAVMTFNVEVDY